VNVSLSPELRRLVRDKVSSGRYTSASEVVREGLRLLEERDEIRTLRREALRRAVRLGLDELDRGRSAPLDVDAIRAEARRRRGGDGTG